MFTLQTVSVDLLLNVGTYLEDTDYSEIDNINEITRCETQRLRHAGILYGKV